MTNKKSPGSPIAICQAVESNLVGWRMHRFRKALAGPLAIVTAGTLRPVADLWARLHERSGHPAWALSPYTYRRRRLPPNTRTLLLSRGGRHHDILKTFRYALKLDSPVHAVVQSVDAPLVSMMREYAPDNEAIVLDRRLKTLTVPPICRLIPYTVLAAVVNGQSGPFAPYYSVRVPQQVQLGDCTHYVIFAAGLARPAGLDLSIRISEMGLGPTRVIDPREFSHAYANGYNPLATCFIFCCLPADLNYVQAYRNVLPEGTSSVVISTTRTGVPGAISLMARCGRMIQHLEGVMNVDKQPSKWASDLYYLPISDESF
ncbi:MAG: hypothetical protein VYA30_00595 [Myxococcota bacterium]|nr:hypothetical protein [Myxococcota bacterium]